MCIGTQIAAMKSVKWKPNSQVGMVDTFEDMMSEGEMIFGAHGVKMSKAKVLWELALENLESMQCHKKTLLKQLE
jgi:hypothetical protein